MKEEYNEMWEQIYVLYEYAAMMYMEHPDTLRQAGELFSKEAAEKFFGSLEKFAKIIELAETSTGTR